ncbi:precorrin-3B C(17)-methyltransferase [Oscillatoria sp. FACHB-1407]|uniref:precorrin-3B C(17)-methyltransferase n=1 Tax=Oscillatoria sp. FACHB-1407 TaxID=2692847 RepID=UPI00168447FB|nr:precorrin-3B C(17)-methyltransferase [Oscillatoria sp. FACHB-1407]MBD2461053.1 precorrin-3B C(17)-methyltransferase [Oscillatoria sp. FACHB-1407]
MSLLFQSFQPIAAIATTPSGARVLASFCQSADAVLWVPEAIAPQLADLPTDSLQVKFYSGSLREHLAALWGEHRSFVFSLATGAVVRLVAPLLQDKATDPAVVVVDAEHAISLCGGHQAGADRLTRAIALHLGIAPVLTGGSHELGLSGIDVLGVPFGWQQGNGDWTGVSAAIARREPVQVIQEAGSTLWQAHLPADHPFQFGFPEFNATVKEVLTEPKARVWISAIQRRFAPESNMPRVQWHPRVLWIGVGCERGTSQTVIDTAIRQVLQSNHLAEGAIAGVATIDLKADEVGLVAWCRDRQVPLKCYSAEALREVKVPNPSAVVEAEVGTPSVAEAAALLAAQALSEDDVMLRVPKKVARLEGEPGAVTVAIAQAEQEFIGHSGKLWLIGTGPGQLDQMTPAAQTAVSQADAVIGYGLYIDLIRPLLRPGQIIEALPITQERQRAQRAIALAQWGLTVAVVSSGDSGIYGMAGLVLEELQAKGWDGQTPEIQVFPGITALQAAASRVGTPLMHDFCAISLSDLLTPWDVIEKRLTAAAAADFVTALYNPRSQTRTQQIAIAQQIFLQHRDPQTPVAIVRSAYRPDEQIQLTTLEKLLDTPIDMLTTVLIGNQSTRAHANWMITPRGYLGKREE